MDQQRFDELTRRLSRSRSRRAVLKGLIAGAAGGLLGVSTGGVALARGPISSSSGTDERSLIMRWILCNLDHRRDPSWDFCGGECVDLGNNHENCGTCGHACASCEQCVDGQCVTACDDSNACTTDTCDHNTGECLYTPINCDDGNPCTIDTCDPDLGCVHEPVDCSDNNACTVDTCDPVRGCVHEPINCDDGNICTIDTCDTQTGCVHTPVDCDDGDPCTVDTCDPQLGCVHTPVDCGYLQCQGGQCV